MGGAVDLGGQSGGKPSSGATMKKKSNNHHDHDSYERQANLCKALANPTRLQLIEMLAKKQRWASELQQGLGISKANLSQHLAVLRAAGVVSAERDGKQLCCGIALPETSALLKNISRMASRASGRAG